MENILAKVKGLLKNKNLVTIVGVIVVLGLLYWGYSTQINNAVVPVEVPVAAKDIQPRTEITDDMVTMIEVPTIAVSEKVITSKATIVGKYSNVNALIPEGSMFYKNTVIEENKIPDSVFENVKKGEIVYSFDVDIHSTYGNSIMPGNKIDIYMKTGNGTVEEKVMLGKLVENLKVLAVKDGSGKDVFENTEEERTPAMFIFGVPEEIYLLLMKASYLESVGVELFPVPHGGQVNTAGATEVSTQQLADYIEAHSVNIPITKKQTIDKLLPTFVNNNGEVTITYPKGCGKKYKCSYLIEGQEAVAVKKTKKKLTFVESTKVTATVTENSDGTEHVASFDVKLADVSSGVTPGAATNSATTNQATG